MSCKGTSAPGLALICAGTGPHLRRDRPTSAPGLCRYTFGARSLEQSDELVERMGFDFQEGYEWNPKWEPRPKL